jgi:hypothetical protein
MTLSRVPRCLCTKSPKLALPASSAGRLLRSRDLFAAGRTANLSFSGVAASAGFVEQTESVMRSREESREGDEGASADELSSDCGISSQVQVARVGWGVTLALPTNDWLPLPHDRLRRLQCFFALGWSVGCREVEAREAAIQQTRRRW